MSADEREVEEYLLGLKDEPMAETGRERQTLATDKSKNERLAADEQSQLFVFKIKMAAAVGRICRCSM